MNLPEAEHVCCGCRCTWDFARAQVLTTGLRVLGTVWEDEKSKAVRRNMPSVHLAIRSMESRFRPIFQPCRWESMGAAIYNLGQDWSTSWMEINAITWNGLNQIKPWYFAINVNFWNPFKSKKAMYRWMYMFKKEMTCISLFKFLLRELPKW